MSINKVVITGNLTRDVEVRTTQSGTIVATIGVAVNDRVKNASSGEWEEYANYFNCVLFGKRAQSLQQYLTKGTKVAVDGKLRWSSWEKEGQKHNKIEILVDNLELLRSGNKNSDSQPGVEAYSAPSIDDLADEEIPF